MYDILIIDNDPLAGLLAEKALAKWKLRHSLQIIHNPEELANKLNLNKQPKPSLTLLDWNLPRLHGREMLPILKRNSPETPVVVVTSSNLEIDRQEALSLGASAYIVKELDFYDFSDSLIKECEHLLC